MNTDNQLSELNPVLVFILITLAGIAGEMYRAAMPHVTWQQIVALIILRSGASIIAGYAALFIALSKGADFYMASGVSLFVAMLGADIVGTLFSRFIAQKLGLSMGGKNAANPHSTRSADARPHPAPHPDQSNPDKRNQDCGT